MEPSALLIFTVALFVAAGSPGPSTAALVARVLVAGWRDVMPFVTAMVLGEWVWLTCAIAGLATIAEQFHWAFQVLKYGGVAYLLYLAYQMWTAPTEIPASDTVVEPTGSARMFFAGIAVTLGNPKIMLFYLALLPSIIDLGGVTILRWMEFSAIMLIVLILIYSTYILLTARARMLLGSPHAVKIANRIAASAMAGAAAFIAIRENGAG